MTMEPDISFTKHVKILDIAQINKDFNVDVFVKGNSAIANATGEADGYNSHTETLSKTFSATPDPETHLGYSGSISESIRWPLSGFPLELSDVRPAPAAASNRCRWDGLARALSNCSLRWSRKTQFARTYFCEDLAMRTYRVDSKTVRIEARDDAESIVLEVVRTGLARSRADRNDPPVDQ